jgi:hypothetical protein
VLARYRCLLHPQLVLRQSDSLQPFDVEFNGSRCCVYPPFQRLVGGSLDDLADPPVPSDTTVEDLPTFVADVIQVDVRGEFDRRDGGDASDVLAVVVPLLQLILTRFRTLANASFIRVPGEPNFLSWSVQYLTDAGEAFEKRDGFVRGRGALGVNIEQRAWMAPELWAALRTVTAAPRIPPSNELLLDAREAWPHVGASVVLSYAAIEHRIATALDVLARLKPEVVSPTMWAWLSDRDDYRKEPSVEEQLSDLMQLFVGRSLKDERMMWNSYNELRKARNSFVHEGVAMSLNRTRVSPQRASQLVADASSIIAWIEQWLPEEERAPRVDLPNRTLSRMIPITRAR